MRRRAEDPHELRNLAGGPEYAALERRFLQHIVDFIILCKGAEFEAYDFVPAQQVGVARKHPDWRREFKVAFPLSPRMKANLRERGLRDDYNDDLGSG